MIDTSTWVVGKAQTTPDQFLQASVRPFDIANKKGKERPFNYETAVGQYRGWMYAAIWMNAKASATTPLKLYVRKGPGEKLVNSRGLSRISPRQRNFMLGKSKRCPSEYVRRKAVEWGGEFEEVVDAHPVTTLLEKPNPYMLGYEFACMRSMFTQLTGNFYVHPIVESLRVRQDSLSRIRELWVMPSQYVKIQLGEPNEQDIIKGYWYGIDSTRAKLFKPDEVAHLRVPNPMSSLYGYGVIEAAWDTWKLSVAQRETDQARYDNQSRPDLAVITESANVTISQLKELQEEWARLFRGTFRQGAPVFLTGKTQVIPLNWTPTEIGDREIIIEEIAAITGVPVSLLKANDPNLASAQVGFASWREQTILPYCRMDEEYLNSFLMPAFGIEGDAFLCYDDPVPENRDEVQAEIGIAMQHGTMTRNEVRIMSGHDPVDDDNADTLLVPAGLTPIDKVGEMPSFGSSFSLGGGNDSGKEEKQPPEEKTIYQSDDLFHHKALDNDDVRDGEPDRLVRSFMLSVSRVFETQRKAVLGALYGRKAVDAGTLARIVAAIMKTSPEMAEAVAPHIGSLILSGGKQGMKEIGLPEDTFDIVNPKVASFIQHYSIKLAGEVNTYSAERLAKELATGFEEGDSTSELAGRVNDVYSDFSGARSEVIARTESARAFIEGSHEAWRESDMVEGKVWSLANASCPICKAIAAKYGQTPIPLDQPFASLGSVIPLPGGKVYNVDYSAIMGPPGHPNCRCATSPVMKKRG